MTTSKLRAYTNDASMPAGTAEVFCLLQRRDACARRPQRGSPEQIADRTWEVICSAARGRGTAG